LSSLIENTGDVELALTQCSSNTLCIFQPFVVTSSLLTTSENRWSQNFSILWNLCVLAKSLLCTYGLCSPS